MDDSNEPDTPRKVLWRSASWSGRPSPPAPAAAPSRPPRAGRPSLPPLQPLAVSRLRHPPNEWPRQGSDDSGHLPHHHRPPPTPSAAAPDRECSRVADHVYLGSDSVARDRESLRRHGITHVLNCVGAACPDYFRGELAYKTLWLRDSPAEDITSVLYDAFDYLEDARAAGGRVLVHCLRGASRSAALVVAYLMWRDDLEFEEALRRVRASRSAADPNLGFAAQLLRCQRRILGHALPPPGSPSSPAALPRVYRMAPHSAYDPLHLVPKSADPARISLDSRGAFLVHAPSSAVFVWLGRACEPAMADSATAAARQVVHYERAQGPILIIHEGSESSDFWDALTDPAAVASSPKIGRKRVELYDLDFEIFRRALKGGVVPPLPMPGTATETRLPARESGWSRVRQKFLMSGVKEFGVVLATTTAAAAAMNEEETGELFLSPGSLSYESSTTPSSSSADSASTMSTFSPASMSSLEWNKYSPPALKLHITPPPTPPPRPPLSNPLSSSLPSPAGKEIGDNSSCISTATTSLAERRGGIHPLISLPPAVDGMLPFSPRDIVRDWCLSPAFIPEEEEDCETAKLNDHCFWDNADMMSAEEEDQEC